MVRLFVDFSRILTVLSVFTLDLEQFLSGTPLDSAIGVLQISVNHARGLKATKIGGGAPDPYVTLSINQRAALAKTKHKDSTWVRFFLRFHLLSIPIYHAVSIQHGMRQNSS